MEERISLIKIKKAINEVLKSQIPTVDIYDRETEEGFNKPTFITSVVPLVTDHETINFNSNRVMVVINYFNGIKEGRDLDNLKMHDKLIEAFRINIKIGKRTILLNNIRSEQIDGILQFRFDLNYMDHMDRQEDERDPIGEVVMEVNIKE